MMMISLLKVQVQGVDGKLFQSQVPQFSNEKLEIAFYQSLETRNLSACSIHIVKFTVSDNQTKRGVGKSSLLL